MAYLGKAWVFAVANDPGLLTQAKALVETARPLRLNEREQAHLAALSHLVQGARAAAVAVLDRHLMHYPFDLIAHQAAALIDGFLGRFPWVRDRSARALPFWSKDQPGYGTLLAFHGFGLEEAGDYSRAEDESRAAAELEPLSFWPHHTVAHVMEMTGRPEDGLGWMAAREALWSTPGHMNQVHIWWHKSLFHLELGQYDAALALYDGPMRATQRPVALSLTNATALLWRLDTLGCDIGDRWQEQADLWQDHADGKCLVFADMHAAMAELRSGHEAPVERRLEAMRETAASGFEAAGLYRTVGIPVVEGLAGVPPRRLRRGGRVTAAGPCRSVADRRQPRATRHRRLDPDRGRRARRSARRCPVAGTRTPGDPSAQRPKPPLSPPRRGHRGLIAPGLMEINQKMLCAD